MRLDSQFNHRINVKFENKMKIHEIIIEELVRKLKAHHIEFFFVNLLLTLIIVTCNLS